MPQAELLHPCDVPSLAVAEAGPDRRLVATGDIASGTIVLNVDGLVSGMPTRHSVQIGAGEHLAPPPDTTDGLLIAQYPWIYLNHSCAPNCRLVGRQLIAMENIHAGDDVTFDYTTTEHDMAEPFHCRCGTPGCLGTIRGARYLTAAARAARAGWLPPYLAAS